MKKVAILYTAEIAISIVLMALCARLLGPTVCEWTATFLPNGIMKSLLDYTLTMAPVSVITTPIATLMYKRSLNWIFDDAKKDLEPDDTDD